MSAGEIAVNLAEKDIIPVGNSRATWLEIKNDTDDQIQIQVSGVSNGDWDGDSRPDHKFQDSVIQRHSSKKERQELNSKNDSAWSTMTVFCDGKEQFAMRVNQ
ncbi:unnamed protein product [Didymodactylos carnosus]|uniref:Uncharacterized protein n=1 Tax=Didymodactylos carnosus TaxID=1234261 RepID=A0A8S2FGS9_9BILA|nr:unnamed protein product [Didymodactylos carnosus]CAF4253729.1 unnamed protein product [Didymodactylos carnosus]